MLVASRPSIKMTDFSFEMKFKSARLQGESAATESQSKSRGAA